MVRFPQKEAEIAELAERLYRGLLANNALFPQPPIHPVVLRGRRLSYLGFRNAYLAARAGAEAAVTAKEDALDALVEAMKSDLRYAENTVGGDDHQLKLLGWSGPDTPSTLAPPGQTRQLEAPRQGTGWVFLDWKAPTDGGKPAAYKVQRRGEGAEPVRDRWQDVATAIPSEITLVDQPRGVTLEFRVVAVNKTGAGPESNVVTVVL